MELFTSISRDDRQKESVNKWLRAKGIGTLECCTGYGKTRCALMIIERLLTKYPSMKVIVVVPTEMLQLQWKGLIDKKGWQLIVEVLIINTASKYEYQCDLLIIDEIHLAAAKLLSNVFNTIKYKLILGLTATFERIDNRHTLIEKYCPIVDSIPIEVARLNKWVSEYNEYLVLVDVPDIEEYNAITKEFNQHYEFFDYNFELISSLAGKDGFEKRKAYTNTICQNPNEWSNVFKQVTYHATGFWRTMSQRKSFIYNHPKKIELAKEIIAHRPDKKIVTFCANSKVADSFGFGYVYTGKEGKKKNRISLEEFTSKPTGVLHSCKMFIQGADVPNLSVGIMIGVDSSSSKSQQSRGRVVRKEGDKQAEYFTIVINNTVEVKWWKNAHKYDADSIIKIDEEGLRNLLDNKPYELYKQKLKDFNFRF